MNDEELNQKLELMGDALKIVELIYEGNIAKARNVATQVLNLLGAMWCSRCQDYVWGPILEIENPRRDLCESCYAIEATADEDAKAESLDQWVKGE